jgi:4-hydroxy-tetrahydrodipicolinate synthase
MIYNWRMTFTHPLAGVYAAAVTPLRPNYSPDLDALPHLLDFLARRGCHGALLLGTTGEGPSFASEEKLAIFRAALAVRQVHPQFRLLAGSGAPSLTETITLTKAAFELGFEVVVVLPPYYYRKASDEGLYVWFSEVLRRAVPAGGALLGYHIPSVAGIGLSLELLARLKDAFPSHFAGLKDSSSDPEYARQLSSRFGNDLLILSGNDQLFTYALDHHAQGCIAALGNLFSVDLRRIWESHNGGQTSLASQERMARRREIMDRYPPVPAFMKTMLARREGFPRWPVRPPLLPLSPNSEEQAARELNETDAEG